MNAIDHGFDIQRAVSAPRVHHQWWPDELRVEASLPEGTIRQLKKKGHRVVIKAPMGASQSIMIKDGLFYGGADPRRSTSLAAGF